jgi:hypothetical protein
MSKALPMLEMRLQVLESARGAPPPPKVMGLPMGGPGGLSAGHGANQVQFGQQYAEQQMGQGCYTYAGGGGFQPPQRGAGMGLRGTPLFPLQLQGMPSQEAAHAAASGMLGMAPLSRPPVLRTGLCQAPTNLAPPMASSQSVAGHLSAALTTAGLGNSISGDVLQGIIAGVVASNKAVPTGFDMEVNSDLSGARGALARAKEKSRIENDPAASFLDLQRRTRAMLQRAPGQPTGFAGLIGELPWGTLATAKRAFAALAQVADALDQGNLPLAHGRVAQGMRWLVMHLEVRQRDPCLAWRMMFTPDPVHIIHVNRQSSQLNLDINNSVLCPAQLTSVVGLSRDMELLSKRLHHGTWYEAQDGEKDPKEPKGKGKGKEREKGKDKKGGMEGREKQEE